MFSSIFKLIYFCEFVVVLVVRKRFTARDRKKEFVSLKKSTGDIVLLLFDGIGMILPLVYVLSGILDFADYDLPNWLGWLGAFLFASAIYVLYRSHADLGKYWSPILAIQKGHKLITTGIYSYVRHPMYAAHLLWAVAQILMLHNWIAGYSFIVVMVPHYFLRVDSEEQMLIDRFGQQYEAYKKRTGRILPKFLK